MVSPSFAMTSLRVKFPSALINIALEPQPSQYLRSEALERLLKYRPQISFVNPYSQPKSTRSQGAGSLEAGISKDSESSISSVPGC